MSTRISPALILFDFDGVIADSEVISLTTLSDTLCSYGVVLAPDEVRERFLGKSVGKIITEVRGLRPDADWDGFAAQWHAILFARFASDLTPVPGVTGLLDRLDARSLPYCIASSSGFARIRVALDVMGLSARFADVFSAEEVRHGKPAPDLFLHAARRMGAAPARCIVIEDSPYGIQAARSAGMTAIGFLGGAHLDGARGQHANVLVNEGAHAVTATLAEIDGLIADRC